MCHVCLLPGQWRRQNFAPGDHGRVVHGFRSSWWQSQKDKHGHSLNGCKIYVHSQTPGGHVRRHCTWWRSVDVNEMALCTWHCHVAAVRNVKSSSPDMWPLDLPDINPVDYSVWGILRERVYRSQIHDVKLWRSWKNLCWGSEGCWYWTIPLSRQWLWSGVVVWAHVFLWALVVFNTNFVATTFWYVLFVSSIPVSINMFDITCESAWNVLVLWLRLLHGTVAAKQICVRKFLHVSKYFGILLWRCARKSMEIRAAIRLKNFNRH